MWPLPRVMRAVVLSGHGGYEQLSLRHDVPVPRPGPLEVLVRVGAAAVNNTDINTRVGWYAKSTKPDSESADGSSWSGGSVGFPLIQGADACGHIVAVGSGVTADRIGQRVAVEPVFRRPGGERHDVVYFGSDVAGAFADFAVVPSQYAHQVATLWTDAEVASVPCSSSAAENLLERAGVCDEDRVLVTGASGGVGSAAVQLAARRGAAVTAVAGRAKHDCLQQLGATALLDREVDVVAAFGKGSFDVVVDIVGGPRWPKLLDVLRPNGRYAVAGAIGGPMVELDLRTLYLKDLLLIGCTVLEPQVFPNLIGYIERNEIRPLVAATFALEEIVAAQKLFLAKQHVGKIVLSMTQDPAWAAPV